MRTLIVLAAAASVAFASAASGAAHRLSSHSTSQLGQKSTWEYRQNGKLVSVMFDGDDYRETSSGKVLDHGRISMRRGKLCFDSAVNKNKNGCWTRVDVPVGQSAVTVSDKGERLRLKRIS